VAQPREWGQGCVVYFSFLEKGNEGFSNLTAWTAYLEYGFPEIGLTPYLNFGLHFLPILI